MLRNHHKLFGFQDTLSEIGINFLNTFGIKKRPVPQDNARLDGRTIIVTGCNRGIGKLIATDLAKRGARVIMAVRNVEGGESARDEILQEIPDGRADIIVMKVDMSSIPSIEQFVQKVIECEDHVDYLIHNAGIMTHIPRKSDQGFESMMAVNYYGVVYLTMKLLDKMLATSSDPRVLITSSLAHHETKTVGYENLQWTPDLSYFNQYGRTKLALMLFGRELINRTHSKGLRVYLVDPGVAKTEMFDDAPRFHYVMGVIGKSLSLMRSIKGSANSMVMSVMSDKEKYDHKNYYFTDGKEKTPSLGAVDDEEAMKLWIATSRSLGLNQMENL